MLNYQFKNSICCNLCKAPHTQFKQLGIRLNQSQGFKPKSKYGVSVSIMKCKNCQLIFSNPQPIPNSIEDQYNISPNTYWKSNEFEWDESYFSTELNILKTLKTDFLEDKKALDIGAGYGRCMLSFEKAGFDAYGFEPSLPFYNMAIEKFGISKDKIKLSTIENIEYPDNFFDFITFGAVLEHLHDPDESIKMALKWLKPGGVFHIEVPSSNWFIGKLFNFYYKYFCSSNYVTNLSPMHPPFHHFEFSNNSFLKNGELNGYKIIYSKIEVCSTMLPKPWFDFLLKKYMKWTNTGLQLIIFLQKNN